MQEKLLRSKDSIEELLGQKKEIAEKMAKIAANKSQFEIQLSELRKSYADL